MKESATVKYLFLLGGHDLEMLTIRKILLRNGSTFADRQLSWGAKLSACLDLLQTPMTIVGIELIPDVPRPPGYITIDHHNENTGCPSAIEQVAGLLSKKLTPYQQLVAVNDTRYIPGLLEMGVSREKIQTIRKRDRKAQGITLREEKMALQSIRNDLIRHGDLTEVYTRLTRFSPIPDYLFPYGKLLIRNDTNLTYYGQGASQLAEKYQSLIRSQKAYSGGGPHGYFGTAKNSLSKNSLQHLRDEIILLLGEP